MNPQEQAQRLVGREEFAEHSPESGDFPCWGKIIKPNFFPL
jgi:hypothetical protein